MIPDINPVLALVSTSAIIALVLFLPVFIEIKKPKDDGPRLIDGVAEFGFHRPLINIEKEQKFDSRLVNRLSFVFASLPNLEV